VGPLISKLSGVGRALVSISHKRPIQIAIVLSSMGLMLYTLVSSSSRLDTSTLQFDWLSVLVGLLFTWIAFWLGACAWVSIIRALQPEISPRDAIRYHLLSVATKYLPGPGWQQLSKALQLYQHGLSSRQVWALVALEIATMLLTGLATAMQIMALGERPLFGFEIGPGAKLALLVLSGSVYVGLPAVVWQVRSGKATTGRIKAIFALWLWGAEILDVISWLALGTSLWWIARGLVPLSTDAWSPCVVTSIVSFIVGFVVIVAPNGWGIRELTTAALLQFIVPVPANVIIPLASRVVLVAAEFLGVLTFGVMEASKRVFGGRILLPRDSD
jgi:hypothetical protein